MAGVTVLVLFASCGNSNKTDADPFASITHLVDSAMVNKTDSIDREKTSDEPKPIEADESFDDFIYNFASFLMIIPSRFQKYVSDFQKK